MGTTMMAVAGRDDGNSNADSHGSGPAATSANWKRSNDVPEPGRISLPGLGLAGLAGMRRRKAR
jgi:hypothetical protein